MARVRLVGAGAAVADLDALVLPDRGRDRGEVRLVAPGLEPRGRVEVEALAGDRRPVGQLLRERGEELELGRAEHGAEAELADRTRDAGHEQRFGFFGGEAGEAGAVPVDELAPAVAPRLRVHRDAGRAERFEVAIDGAHRDLERFRELARGDAAPVLQEQEESHEPAGAHGRNISGFADRSCQGTGVASRSTRL